MSDDDQESPNKDELDPLEHFGEDESSGDDRPDPVVIPTPLIAGTFAAYDDGVGGYVLVTDTHEHGTMRRHIPGKMVKLAARFMFGRKQEMRVS